MSSIHDMPDSMKRALMAALVRDGVKPPGDNEPADDTHAMMMEAIHLDEGSDGESFKQFARRIAAKLDDRVAATPLQAAALVARAGPCRFAPGDLVEWDHRLHCENYSFPKLGEVCVVTQVFDPALHDTKDASGTEIAVRHDMAVAFHHGDDEVHEYTYDSRRFELVAKACDAASYLRKHGGRHVSRP